MIVALPKFNEIIAPSFEVTRYFILVRVENGKVMCRETIQASGCEGFGRVTLLRENKVDVLICSGIKEFYLGLLCSSGISVIANIAGTLEEVLDEFLRGDLTLQDSNHGAEEELPAIPLDDLICWTKELFTSHGYAVYLGTERAPFPVDLIAEIECPVCRKAVRVAICCGAHTYRSDQEIKLLHQAAANDYHAEVYVHPTTSRAKRCCAEYGIELIDPDAKFAHADYPVANRIPILQQVVVGHEPASGPPA